MAAGSIALGEQPTVGDMISDLPDDIFSGAPPPDNPGDSDTGTADDGAGNDDLGDVADVDFDDAAPVADLPPAQEPPAEEPPADDAAPPTDKAAAPGTDEDADLPDGIRYGKNRKGEDTAFVKKTRWDETIYPAYKLTQAAAEAIGEPLTLEAITKRETALRANENLFSNLNSADPTLQGDVLNFVFKEMKAAYRAGETNADPAVSFADTFVDRLQTHSPEGYAALRLKTAQALANEIYEHAARTDDVNLFHGVGHVVRFLSGLTKDVKSPAHIAAATDKLGLPFHVASKMKELGAASASGQPTGGDPALRREIAELREKIEGRTAESHAEQYRTWKSDTDATVVKAVLDEAITPALASIASAWKDFPEDYQEEVVKRLNSQINDKLAADVTFKTQIKGLLAQGKRATNEAVRNQISSQIQSAFVNRAKLLASSKAIRGPILERASTWLASRSNRNHERRQVAQERTTARGAPTGVPRSATPKAIIDMLGDTYDADAAFRQGLALLESR